jgi:hypothetical protein
MPCVKQPGSYAVLQAIKEATLAIQRCIQITTTLGLIP